MIARLIASVELAPEIRQFLFEIPEVDRLDFLPGQFVSLSAVIGEKKITRAYSLASPPAQNNRFEICLNRVTDGLFSPRLFAMEPGETVEMRGPLGALVWKEPRMDAILVATGTGVVPYRPMIQDSLTRGETRQLRLIYGTRLPESQLYTEEFRRWEREYPQFRFVPTVTRPDKNWAGVAGRVQAYVREALGERTDWQVYICGQHEMVDSVRELCKEHGLDRKQIIVEKYD